MGSAGPSVRDLIGRQLQVDSQRFEHIGGAGAAGDAAITVLCHRLAGGRRDQGGDATFGSSARCGTAAFCRILGTP